MRRFICLKVLSGERLDGTGRVCIHLFVQDEGGSFTEPHVLHPDGKRVSAKPTRGRLACDSSRNVAPVTHGSTTTITMRTDDPQAVTCLKCLASEDYASLRVK